MPRPIALLLLLSVTVAAPLTAQVRALGWRSWRAPSLANAAEPQGSARQAHSASTPTLILAGLGGGTVGLFAGGLGGWQIGGGNSICGDDACGLEGGAYGAIIGESALLPLAVHLANHHRGSYWLSLLASAGIGAAGVVAVDATNDGWPLIGVPIGQMITSILIERATAKQ